MLLVFGLGADGNPHPRPVPESRVQVIGSVRLAGHYQFIRRGKSRAAPLGGLTQLKISSFRS